MKNKGGFRRGFWRKGLRSAQDSVNDMWDGMSEGIRKVAKETFDESRGFKPKDE